MIKKLTYGGVGLSVTLFIVGHLLSEIPEVNIPDNQVASVLEDDMYGGLDIDPRDYDFDGDFEMPSTFDTYHITEEDFTAFEKNSTVEIGRKNPMMFDTKGREDYSAGASYTWEDVTQDVEVEDGHVLGFDLGADKQGGGQITMIESASIAEKFANYAVYPVDKKYYNFSSYYGPRMDPFIEDKEVFHGGIDIAAIGIDGQDVYSVLPGAVAHVGFNEKGYGNFIVINHGEFATLYAHLKERPSLKVEDEVKAGDKIGIIGSTGRSTGPHLHLEVTKDNTLIDPKPLLDSIGTGIPAVKPAKETVEDEDVDLINEEGEE